MEQGDFLSIRPGEVSDATGQLTELADRVSRVMQAEALNLTVEAPARDEVSQRVAATLNEVHSSFSKVSDQGHHQLGAITATLGNHVGDIVAADEGPAL